MASVERDDDRVIFWPDPIEGETPPELSTGDPLDDQLLRQIAARVASLETPREWIHYVAVPDVPSARAVAELLMLEQRGFDVEVYTPDAPGEPYALRATRENTILTAELVRTARELFNRITSQVPGAEYDGWEVSIDPNEILEAIPGST